MISQMVPSRAPEYIFKGFLLVALITGVCCLCLWWLYQDAAETRKQNSALQSQMASLQAENEKLASSATDHQGQLQVCLASEKQLRNDLVSERAKTRLNSPVENANPVENVSAPVAPLSPASPATWPIDALFPAQTAHATTLSAQSTGDATNTPSHSSSSLSDAFIIGLMVGLILAFIAIVLFLHQLRVLQQRLTRAQIQMIAQAQKIEGLRTYYQNQIARLSMSRRD